MSSEHTILLVGNPNSGKTTVFNRLTGASARVGNYPGITVERMEGSYRADDGTSYRVIDLPGTYSLTARSFDEALVADTMVQASQGTNSVTVVLVLDATSIERSLYLAHQVLTLELPTVVALNMMDEVKTRSLPDYRQELSTALGDVALCPISAAEGTGWDAFRSSLERSLTEQVQATAPPLALRSEVETLVTHVAASLPEKLQSRSQAWARWALLSHDLREHLSTPTIASTIEASVWQSVEEAQSHATAQALDLELELIAPVYAWAEAQLQPDASPRKSTSEPSRAAHKLDDVLTHPVWGLAIFLAVMTLLFQLLFSWSDPAIGVIETLVGFCQQVTLDVLPEGPLADLVANGIIAGVGNVIVFVPQIAILFLMVTLLEDSGYLARVAFVLDRMMGLVGLHGKAFIPMLSGVACAIPAIMATRTIENRKDRLLTMMVIPLMSCSARLPVYVLVTAVVFAGAAPAFGFLDVGAIVLASMYALSIFAALFAAAVLRRTVVRGKRPAFILELPPYRRPILRNVLISTWQRVKVFLIDAGTVILAFTIVLWALLNYPKDEAAQMRFDQQRAQITRAGLPADVEESQLARVDDEESSYKIDHSILGRLGHAIEPAIEPLGMDHRIGIAILGAFAAREVFVSTLGIIFGQGETDEEDEGLRNTLADATHDNGEKLLTPLSGVALMVFFVLACQCMSTLAVLKRETGGYRIPIFVFAYMSILAYVAALLVYQIGTALGLGTS